MADEEKSSKATAPKFKKLTPAERKVIASAIIEELISPAGFIFEHAANAVDYGQNGGNYTQSGGGDHDQWGGGNYDQSAVMLREANLMDSGSVLDMLDRKGR